MPVIFTFFIQKTHRMPIVLIHSGRKIYNRPGKVLPAHSIHKTYNLVSKPQLLIKKKKKIEKNGENL